jgi:uncharacterized protein
MREKRVSAEGDNCKWARWRCHVPHCRSWRQLREGPQVPLRQHRAIWLRFADPSPLLRFAASVEATRVETKWLDAMSTSECSERLRAGRLGRVGLSINALPVILPVFYEATEDSVLFFTEAGTKLAAAAVNAVVAFETDGLDDDGGWSVMVLGRCEEVLSLREIEAWRDAPRLVGAPGRRDHLVRIPIQHLSGRSFAWAELTRGSSGYP